ncbi:MAG: NTP transferase domain-containing protein [Acidobacteria bacterium]|nr:NTP transferase domain-containing protein [Acidobacteriota bacterium]
MKGFILAAGFGTRLLPITHHVPKVLVELAGQPLADYSLRMLREAGIGEIGINAHHLAEQIVSYGKSRNLSVFRETEILGTGGYLSALGSFFNEDMLTVNGDALFFGDGAFTRRLRERHKAGSNLITLLLMPRLDKSDATGLDFSRGRVTGLGSGNFFFTGCQILSPEILPMVKHSSIVPLYRELIAAGKLGGEVFQGDWFDCGTRKGLLAAHRFVTGKDTFIYPGATVEPGAEIDRSVVYGGGIVRSGAELIDSILMKGEVASGTRIEGEILA